MTNFEWIDECGDTGRVSANSGTVRVMLRDSGGGVVLHAVTSAKAREIAAALLEAADAACKPLRPTEPD